jgi:hypothetical protein
MLRHLANRTVINNMHDNIPPDHAAGAAYGSRYTFSYE